jgi:hypothetical protein
MTNEQKLLPASPCQGCKRAILWERNQLIELITDMIDKSQDYIVTGSEIIELIQDRITRGKK